MTFRRATASAVIGLAIAIGSATPAHAAASMWIDYIYSGNETQASSSGMYRSLIGTSPSGQVVRIAAHAPGGWQVIGSWAQANGGLCLIFPSTTNMGMLENNGLGYAQEMRGYVNTAGSC